jgi:hypothetical protein
MPPVNEVYNAACRARRAHKKAIGECVHCLSPARPGLTMCASCAADNTASSLRSLTARLPTNCPCGKPRAGGYSRLCVKCCRSKRRLNISKMFAARCKTEDGFVVFVNGASFGSSDIPLRIIDLAPDHDDVYEPVVSGELPIADEFDLLPIDEGDDWRTDSYREGASAEFWFDPKDHVPPSWDMFRP